MNFDCPYCGLFTPEPHDRTERCIEALRKEIERQAIRYERSARDGSLTAAAILDNQKSETAAVAEVRAAYASACRHGDALRRERDLAEHANRRARAALSAILAEVEEPSDDEAAVYDHARAVLAEGLVGP